MIHCKTAEEVQKIREGAKILAKAHAEVAQLIRPGITTLDLDKAAEAYIRDHHAAPSFKNYKGFPFALCVSVNDVVVHGFPSGYRLKETDIVSIDCGVYFKGYHSDSAYTYPMEKTSAETIQLMQRTYEALELGIEKAKAGNRVGDIGSAIQEYVEGFNYGVVRELVGHGIGKRLHEEPEVPNFGKRGKGAKLLHGTVIAIEPMINLGRRDVVQESDGWTIRTKDKKPSAHFEHTVAIWNDKTEALTTHEYLEEKYWYKWRNKSR